MSSFWRSNILLRAHVPSSTKANSIGFQERRVDSVENKTDEGEGGEVTEHSHLGGKKGLQDSVYLSLRTPASGKLILQLLAKVN